MFDYTKAAFKKILDDFKRLDFLRNVLTQSVYIAYLIYAVCAQSGVLWVNIALLALSVAYFAFYLFIRAREVDASLKRTVKKSYKWSKRGVKLVNLGITIYTLTITVNHSTVFSVILTSLMIVGWVLEILFEAVYHFLIKKAKLVLAGLEADYKKVVQPAKTVGNFFKTLFGKQVEPEPEPTPERETLDKIVAEERQEKENQKAEKRAQFSLWLQDKLPFLHRKKDIPDDGQTVDEQIHTPVEEEICIDEECPKEEADEAEAPKQFGAWLQDKLPFLRRKKPDENDDL